MLHCRRYPYTPPHGYGFGKGIDFRTCTRTLAYPWLLPMWVSIPVSITTWHLAVLPTHHICSLAVYTFTFPCLISSGDPLCQRWQPADPIAFIWCYHMLSYHSMCDFYLFDLFDLVSDQSNHWSSAAASVPKIQDARPLSLMLSSLI